MIGACHTIRLFLLTISYGSNKRPLLHNWDLLLLNNIHIEVVKLECWLKSLKADKFIAAMNHLLNIVRVISFVDRSDRKLESMVSFGLDPRNLFLDRFYLVIISRNCISLDGINDVLHEFAPFHHTVAIDINLSK